ncbi:MAG: hypothetical protein AAF927_23680 [Bacteroidota bacterium]
MSKITRYPGIAPFSRAYKDVFFGRSKDVEALYKSLNVNDFVVLHGKSGMGKSSLLNAGLIPIIEKRNQFFILFIRFGSYNPHYPENLNAIFREKIRAALAAETTFLDEIVDSSTQTSPTLWQYVKQLQWEKQAEKGILIILDQFEEIFTYPSEQVEEFREAYSEIIFNRMPEGFRTRLYEKVEANPELLDQHQQKLAFLDYPPTLKFLMGIRSDRLSFLDRLSPSIPNILKNTYEVKPLRLQQAREAIVKPAGYAGDGFLSPIFAYDPDFLEIILSYLSRDYSREIEPFLLQIICQHIESWVIGQKANGLVVKQADIGELDTVARSYYISVIQGQDLETEAKRFDPHEEILARYLIENQLIDSINHNRISLDKSIVEQQGFPDDMLSKLVNARIIRQEPNTVSGLSYELSHDTLLDPVLQSAQIMGNLEAIVESYYRDKVDKYEQKWLETHFLTKEGYAQSYLRTELSDQSHTDDLIEDRILRQDIQDRLLLFPMFLKPANKIRSERSEEAAQTRRKRLILIGIGLTVLFAGLSIATSSFYNLMQEAQTQQMRADSATKAAVELRLIAERESARAQDSAKSAKEQRQIAITQRLRAEGQSRLAEERRIEAEKERKIALIAARKAEDEAEAAQKARIEASMERDLADSLRKVAEEQLAALQQKDDFIAEQYLTYIEDLRYENPTLALRIAEYALSKVLSDTIYRTLIELATDPESRFYQTQLPPSARFVPGAEKLAVIGQDNNSIDILNYRGDRLQSFYLDTQAPISSFSVSNNGNHVFVTDQEGNFLLSSLDQGFIANGNVNSLGEDLFYCNGVFAPDPNREIILVYTSSDKVGPQLLDFSGEKIIDFRIPSGEVVVGGFFHPTNNSLYFFNKTGLLSNWMLIGKRKKEIDFGETEEILNVSLSPDGKYLLTEAEFTARLCDLNGKTLTTFEGAYNAIFTPDSKYLITTEEDARYATLWDLEGNEIRWFDTEEVALSCAFSPDGQYVMVHCVGGESLLFTVEGAKLARFQTDPYLQSGSTFSKDSDYILIDNSESTQLYPFAVGPKRLNILAARDQLYAQMNARGQVQTGGGRQPQVAQQGDPFGNPGNPQNQQKSYKEFEIPEVIQLWLDSDEIAIATEAQIKRYNLNP